ncbi:MAG: CRTAC1 family protein [Bryobacteraceae bacterium]|nr:CRTAC1 family protein [Bryobacteraceae bacterium]MDW8377508.1 CRTAC1 family protein [Bryobacterales bacterium]
MFGLVLGLLVAAGPWQIYPLPFRLTTGEGARKHLPATMPGGIAVFDYDQDGLLDLFFPNGAALPAGRKTSARESNRLLRNLGNMRFEDRTVLSGLEGAGYDFAALAADYDQDGWTDLLVCGLREVRLYRNLGNGRFQDVTASSGIQNQGRWCIGGAWFDYDRDGDADLFLVNYVRWDPSTEPQCKVDGVPDFCHPRYYAPEPNALFRNDGGGRFTDVSQPSGLAKYRGKGMAAVAADFDQDGYSDLFVTNDRVLNFLFRNLGEGRFEERALELGVAAPPSGNPPSSMGVDAQDFDNDGKVDLLYTALRDETFPLSRNRGADFEDAGLKTKLDLLTRSMAGWGVAFADLDNDGWKDIAVARSDVLSAKGARARSAREPLSWFRNRDGQQFVMGDAIPLAPDMYRGLVAADFDNDGCLDLVVTALESQASVIRHRCQGNWLMVDIRQPGAIVKVGSQRRSVSTSVGYASSCACPLHFGLGAAQTVDVEIQVPGSEPKRFRGVPANQVLRWSP